MGETANQPFQPSFNAALKVEFQEPIVAIPVKGVLAGESLHRVRTFARDAFSCVAVLSPGGRI